MVHYLLLASLLFPAFVTQAQVSWMRCSGGLRDDGCNSVCTDPDGNIFSTGFYYDAAVTFDTISLPNFGGDDIYLNKYSSNGNLLWSKHFGSIYGDRPAGIACDTAGNVYLAASSYGSMTFDTITMDMEGIFLAKMNNNGKVIWVNTYSADFSYNASDVISTDREGNVLMTGSFYSSVSFDHTLEAINPQSWSSDLFITKINANGIPVWSHALGGESSDYVYSVATDPVGNAFISGEYYGPWMKVGADTLFNSYPMSPSNYEYRNAFAVRFTSAGSISWARQTDAVKDEEGAGVCSNSRGECLLAGAFYCDTLFFANDTLINLNGFNYNKSLMLLAYDSLGTPLWARSAQGNDYGSRAQSVITNSDDDILLLAENDSHILSIGDTTLVNNDYYYEVAVLQYDKNGNFLEGAQSRGNSNNYAKGICLGSDEKPILACTIESTDFAFGSISLNRGIVNKASVLVKFGQPVFTSVETNPIEKKKGVAFPNPADTRCYFPFENNTDVYKASIHIYDIAGRLIKEAEIAVSHPDGIEIDTQSLTNGLYIIEIRSSASSQKHKLTVLHQ